MTGPVLVLHTTEGTTIAGAVAAMRRNRSECHEVVDVSANGVITQLLTPWGQSARSLRHPSGTPETNNRRPPVYQVEIVGHADQMGGKPHDWYAALARYLHDLCDRLHVPKRFPCAFVGDDRAYGTGAPQRLSWGQWADVSGIIGHQHVPGNAHWDPGDINRLAPLMGATTGGAAMPSTIANTADQLRQVQRILSGTPHDPGPIDGLIGERTLAALEALAAEAEALRHSKSLDDDGEAALRREADIGAKFVALLDLARPDTYTNPQ